MLAQRVLKMVWGWYGGIAMLSFLRCQHPYRVPVSVLASDPALFVWPRKTLENGTGLGLYTHVGE